MKELIRKSILAGLLIGLSACIYMKVGGAVGACLFSVGLISVLVLEANLFTGKVGYINSKKKFFDALIILFFNLVTAFIIGLLYRVTFGIHDTIGTRFSNYIWYEVLIKGIGTGIFIYLAVEIYKHNKSIITVILCIMAFILGGMYHCVADAAYLGASNITIDALLYFILVIIGNSIGSFLLRLLQLGTLKEQIKKDE